MNGTSDSIRPYISRRMAVIVVAILINPNWSIVKYNKILPPLFLPFTKSLVLFSISPFKFSFIMLQFSACWTSSNQLSKNTLFLSLIVFQNLKTISQSSQTHTRFSQKCSVKRKHHRRFRDTLQVSQRWFYNTSNTINIILIRIRNLF